MTPPTTAVGAAPLHVGPLEVWPPVVLAPMAGVTNSPFRSLCRRHGAGLYVSEMITARAFVEGNAKTMQLASFAPDETPRSIQLYGIDPHYVGEAVRRLVDAAHVDHIDLNFGCPVAKVTRNGGGAALPVRRNLLRAIVAAAVGAAGDVPVTAKFRMGVDDEHLTYLDTGRICEGEGIAAVALHARTAFQLYSGDAAWDAIGRLKAAVGTIPVLGNGDIWEAGDALTMMAATGCDGVVVGRGCLGRPWLFGDLAAAFEGREPTPPPLLGEVCDTMVEHLDLLVAWYLESSSEPEFARRHGARDFRKHTGWYVKGYPVGNELRRQLNQVESPEHLAELLSPLDRTAAMLPEGRRAKRGHQNGPRPVSLPDRWYESADSTDALDAGAESVSSGG